MSFFAVGSLILTAIGTTVSVVAQNQAADAAEDTAAYNAKLDIEQAKQENKVAAENARRKATEEKRAIATARAAAAGNGLSMEGTPLAILGDTVTQLERDIQDLAFDSKNKQRQLMQSASMGMLEGQQTATSLRTQSVGTAISGYSGAATDYAKSKGYLK